MAKNGPKMAKNGPFLTLFWDFLEKRAQNREKVGGRKYILKKVQKKVKKTRKKRQKNGHFSKNPEILGLGKHSANFWKPVKNRVFSWFQKSRFST